MVTIPNETRNDEPTLLSHFSVNEGQQPTVLLIHGMFANQETFKPLHAHLADYSLLIPTLPGHQKGATASDIADLTLQNTSAQLSRLVTAKAHGGHVHVVGHSFGANIALHFASHYPDQILSVFVSGVGGFIQSKMTPYAVCLDGIISYAAPTRLIEYLLDIDPSLHGTEEFGGVRNLALCRAICDILAIPVDNEELLPAEAKSEFELRNVRVLVAAATKKGFLPTDDNLERTQLVAKRLGGVAVQIPSMRHTWYLQDPTLFAQVMVAWIEERGLSDQVIICD